MAAEAGVQGIVLSNHGGRQLEFARSGIEVLVEVIEELKKRKLFPNPKFQVFLDGGVRRATDVLKAVALGATAGMPKQQRLVEKTHLVDSGSRSTILVCVLCIRSRRHRQGTKDPSCKCWLMILRRTISQAWHVGRV